MFRSTVRGFVESEITPHADEWEAEGMFPAAELFAKMGDLGLLGLTYEPRFGGGGAEPIFTAILHEELGRMPCLGVAMAIGVQTDMATPSLHRFGSDELRERYLRPAIEGRHVAAVGITEPDAGSDVAAIRTRAVRDSTSPTGCRPTGSACSPARATSRERAACPRSSCRPMHRASR